MRKKILIDLDDTLNNLIECWLWLYNEKYNDNLQPHDITAWEINNFVKPEAVDGIFKLLETPNLFSELVQPKPDSIKTTQILSKFYDLYIVTACTYPQNIVEKFKWLETYFPHISTDNIITAKDKSLIVGDYMIDDHIGNLITSKCDNKILFLAPHNMINNVENIIRVASWDDILYFFSTENEELKEHVFEVLIDERFEHDITDTMEEITSTIFFEQYSKINEILKTHTKS